MNATAIQTRTSSTPILDRLAPLPESKGIELVNMWIDLAFAVLAITPFFWKPPFMVTFLIWIGRNFKLMMSDADWAGVRLILTGFAIVLMCLLAIAVHKCGHLLAGLSLGFRCRGIRFGRFKIDQNFRVSLDRNYEDARLGETLMIPQPWKNIRLRMTLMLLAGPVANFLAGYAVLRLLQHPALIAGSFIGVSFFFAVVNVLPLAMTSQLTDGARIWMLLLRPARAERYLAILRLADEIDRGVPMESVSPSDLELATVLRDDSPDTVWAHTVAFLAAYSRDDDAKAGQLLETAFTYSGYAGPSARERLALQAAMFQATRRHRIDLARQWLTDVPNATQFPDVRSKIEAMIQNRLKTSGQECHPTSR